MPRDLSVFSFFNSAPADALERIVWLDELLQQVQLEINMQLQTAYFEARLEGRAPAAIELAPHGKKEFLMMTRRENERRGRMVRWGDGLDYGPYPSHRRSRPGRYRRRAAARVGSG